MSKTSKTATKTAIKTNASAPKNRTDAKHKAKAADKAPPSDKTATKDPQKGKETKAKRPEGEAHAAEAKAAKNGKPAAPPSPPEGASSAVAATLGAALADTSDRSGPRPLRMMDPRLPEMGTVVKKVDRYGRTLAEAKIEWAGVAYKDHLFTSLSAAATAAAADLGIRGAQNGFVFWGLIGRTPREGRPAVEQLLVFWGQLSTFIRRVLTSGTPEEQEEVRRFVRDRMSKEEARDLLDA